VKKVEGKKMNPQINEQYETDVLCAECIEISIGECENLYIEHGFESIIENGLVTEFVLKAERTDK
jgi:hypothetical protein